MSEITVEKENQGSMSSLNWSVFWKEMEETNSDAGYLNPGDDDVEAYCIATLAKFAEVSDKIHPQLRKEWFMNICEQIWSELTE